MPNEKMYDNLTKIGVPGLFDWVPFGTIRVAGNTE